MPSGFLGFTGKYEIAMDSKNRLALPTRWKENIGERVFLSDDPSGVLTMRRREENDQLMSQISGLDGFSKDVRTLKRSFFSSLTEVDLDKWKRFVLPCKVMARKKWEHLDSLVLIGMGDYIEIWPKPDYEEWESKEGGGASYEEASERLSSMFRKE